ncbi:hypothetical protein ACWGCW_21040 [Streptomyces sp. NPDC054933]|jgi:tetratricopeptide (TPR) repeat protein
MSQPPDLLVRAAVCYEHIGDYTSAARCREQAGHRLKAAELWEATGEYARAADCWRQAGRPLGAADCLLKLERYEEAAECFAGAGDRLTGGWTLVTRTRSFEAARRMFETAEPRNGGQRLRRRLGLCLTQAQAVGDSGPLVRTLRAVPDGIRSLDPARERPEVELWAVTAAGHIRRPDLAAMVFAASHRAGVRGSTDRWLRWAAQSLGDTTGIPSAPAGTADPA